MHRLDGLFPRLDRFARRIDLLGTRFPDFGFGGRRDLHGPVALLLAETFSDQLFHLVELFDFVDTAEGDGFAVPAGAAGTADPVDIGFRLHRLVIVDDQAEAGNVDAAGRDIRRDQDLAFAAFETVQGSLPGILALVAMDAGGFDAGALQVADDPVHPVTGAGEDQGTLRIQGPDQVCQEVLLVSLVDIVQGLVNGFHGGGDRVHFDILRLRQEIQRQLFHFRRHGGGEEKRLPPLRQGPDDAPDVVNKAHIEHTVRFVQDKDFHPVKTNQALAHQVQQAAGTGDDDVRAFMERLHLRALADAAENDAAGQRKTFAVLLKVLPGLHRQFPGRGKDQRADHLRVRTPGFILN